MDYKTLFPALKIKMPLYEVRCHDKIEWRDISEVEVLGISKRHLTPLHRLFRT